jgi:hypothetical protein
VTEAEWLSSNDPKALVAFVSGRVSDRKLRLFAAACCRDVWRMLKAACARRSVEVGEAYADGAISPQDAHTASLAAWQWFWNADQESANSKNAAASAARTAFPTGLYEYSLMGRTETMRDNLEIVLTNLAWGEHPQEQARLFREIVGNPFAAVSLDPVILAWNGGTVHRLARGMYDERRFDGMPILADALEDAGCTEAPLLEHCRGPVNHVLGCWVLDLILAMG